jgi:hypothetical protein
MWNNCAFIVFLILLPLSFVTFIRRTWAMTTSSWGPNLKLYRRTKGNKLQIITDKKQLLKTEAQSNWIYTELTKQSLKKNMCICQIKTPVHSSCLIYKRDVNSRALICWHLSYACLCNACTPVSGISWGSNLSPWHSERYSSLSTR